MSKKKRLKLKAAKDRAVKKAAEACAARKAAKATYKAAQKACDKACAKAEQSKDAYRQYKEEQKKQDKNKKKKNKKKASPASKAKSKKSKASSKKGGKAAPKKSLARPKATPALPPEPQNLKLVEGIGPKIEQILNGHGVWAWAQLADTSVELLRKWLYDAGPAYRMHDPSTWPLQARLAAQGDQEKLKALQQELRAGRRK